jgi:uncharacterized protein (UPF0276 family)
MMCLSTSLGIGLRHPHYQQMLAEKPKIAWLEVHSENFMFKGGPAIDLLSSINEYYPLSFHGIGLSLGSASGLHKDHLKRLKKLTDQFQPFLLSEHLSWSTVGRTFLPDLLPTPYTHESLQVFANNIDKAQNYLKRNFFIENPSSYLQYNISDYTEVDFLVELSKQTGAKILLDVNNVFVSSFNHQWDPYAYICAIPPAMIGEIHLAGHTIKEIDPLNKIRIDTHDNFVCPEVWDLYRFTLEHLAGEVKEISVLLEWDAKIPALDVLLGEVAKAGMMEISKRI